MAKASRGGSLSGVSQPRDGRVKTKISRMKAISISIRLVTVVQIKILFVLSSGRNKSRASESEKSDDSNDSEKSFAEALRSNKKVSNVSL